MKISVVKYLITWSQFPISILLLGLIWTSVHAAESTDWDTPQTGRIVVFGDVHGAFNELTTLLRQAEVIDDDNNWIGGTTQLVSLGDLFDRGPDSRKVAELLMDLQQQAPQQNGSVHVVLGNHEMMLALGDMRYISPSEYAAYAGEETTAEREELYQQFIAIREETDPPTLRASFDEEFPPGFLAISRSHSLSGELGQWLLQQPIIIKIGDTLFVHGGLSPELADSNLDYINQIERRSIPDYMNLVETLTGLGVLNPTIDYLNRELWLAQLIEQFKMVNGRRSSPIWEEEALELIALQSNLTLSASGPLWYRGTASCHPYIESYNVERILSSWGARRVVIGHTPTPKGRVTSRINGTIIMADTGMFADYYRGRASAVIIENDELSVMYAGETELQKPLEEVLSVPRQPLDFDDAALEQFLLTADIVANNPIGTGITNPHRLTLQQGDITFDALYKSFDSDPNFQTRRYSPRRNNDSDRYVYDIAAYKLDRMLDLKMVPVAVEREVDGVLGVVQLWAENTINERDRLEAEVPFLGQCSQEQQFQMRFLFDILIYNEDRNLTNILWTDDDFRMLFIDHSRSFSFSDRRPEQYQRIPLHLSQMFREKLIALNEENLTRELGDFLHPRQILAILERRDRILNEAENSEFNP